MVDESILIKIKKLLNLSEGNQNENERAESMAKALKLMQEHNLSMGMIDSSVTGPPSVTEAHHDIVAYKWVQSVLSAVGKLYYVTYFLTPRGSGTSYSPVFVGTPENIEVAKNIADWLIQSISKESNRNFKNPKDRDSFRLGAAYSLYQRAAVMREAEKKEAQAPTYTAPGEAPKNALMVIRCQLELANENYLGTKKLGKSRSRSSRVNPYAYSAGKTYGSNISLNKQLGSKTKAIVED